MSRKTFRPIAPTSRTSSSDSGLSTEDPLLLRFLPGDGAPRARGGERSQPGELSSAARLRPTRELLGQTAGDTRCAERITSVDCPDRHGKAAPGRTPDLIAHTCHSAASKRASIHARMELTRPLNTGNCCPPTGKARDTRDPRPQPLSEPNWQMGRSADVPRRVPRHGADLDRSSATDRTHDLLELDERQSGSDTVMATEAE